MSEKNRDSKNRWRNVTIAFRMSPEEDAELDLSRLMFRVRIWKKRSVFYSDRTYAAGTPEISEMER